MATLAYSQLAAEDLDRLADFLLAEHPREAASTASLIAQALGVLEHHPLIGRPVEGLHELVISRGRSGYIALYEYVSEADQVVVHRIRHQRETGFEE